MGKVKEACSGFSRDVEEECLDDKIGVCWNCRYRRWEDHTIECLKGIL